MKIKEVYLIVGIASLFALVFGQKGLADDQILEKSPTLGGQKHVLGEIIVKFKPGVSDKVIADINLRHGTSVISTSRFAGFKRLRIPGRKAVAEVLEIYKRNPNVEYAEPNYIAYAFWVPNDPYYEYQWHLDNPEYGGITMELAWKITTGDPNVIVAVIDTGVAYEDYEEFVDNPGRGKDYWITYQQAPDLASSNFIAGYDFVNDDEHPNDDEGHGTHVSGTIAQSTDNGIGVAGVAFNTSIMPVKVLDSSGSGTYVNIADGIYCAADNGAKIINMSLGGASESITLENAVAYAYGKGVTIVCASGNDGSATTVSYPAAYDAYCIAVGATRYDEEVAYYSNGGPSLDLTAPGGDLSVDQNGDGYADGVLQQTFDKNPTDWGYWFYHGTSMAAPHVSGVAALLIANGVATTPDDVREVLQSTAKDKGATGWDPEYGWGIVDAFAAMTYTQVPNDPPVADAGSDQTASVGEIVTFDGSGSYDIDDGIATYHWDFGDETKGSGETTTHAYSTAGTYTVTLKVTDSGGLTATDTATVTVTEESTLVIHVATIDMSHNTRPAGRNRFTKALATVTIFDASDNPVEGVTVYGSWSGATSDADSGVTDTTGKVTLASDEVKNAPSGTTFTFTVDDVTKSSWTYDSTGNVETSDFITVP